ncbi:hypothetical protein BDV40DRAFT_283871 [Aspergillus tamarii]|uniref:RING-type domain-containing protein n=1 Tax=Aspergillus tamarii TaxID=41984 RepID=A0A5N6UA79_ASPTM|nr:hypothetical protein BDV40DRAFT_283871 [Aspergillus tamarii]
MSLLAQSSHWQWNPLERCHIARPSEHDSCIGQSLNGRPCRNKVSKGCRGTASHRLEILAMCSIDESLIPKLQEIASLLLCRRRHQSQVTSLSEGWCRLLGLLRDETPVPAPARSAARQRGQEVTVAMVQEGQIPFQVSTTRPAVVSVPTAIGGTGNIVFRSFRKGRDISDVQCDICHERHLEDTVYLNCEECTGEFHWECMQRWLHSLQADFSCPKWYFNLVSSFR